MLNYYVIQERFIKRDPWLYNDLSSQSKLVRMMDRVCLRCKDHHLYFEKAISEDTALYFTGCSNCRIVHSLGTTGLLEVIKGA